MPLKSFSELYQSADQTETPLSVIAAGGEDTTVIQALEFARNRGWVRPMLTGNPQRIRERMISLEIDPAGFAIFADADDSAAAAVREVRSGNAALLMKGQIPTPALMKAVLDKEHGLRDGTTIGQVVLMEIAKDRRRFLMTDTGVTIAPTLQQKQDLIRGAVHIASRLGANCPRIAIMSATEKVTPALPDTEEASQLAELANSGQFGECSAQGPLSFDLAYAAEAGSRKSISGEVTGQADVMLFPNLLAANLTVKAIMYTADCQFGGILTGTTHPVVFMSRADSVETRLNSIAYAMQVH